MLRGAGIYVEAAEGLDQLPRSSAAANGCRRARSERSPTDAADHRIPRDIVSITALRSDMETYMAKVSRLGYVVTIAGRGHVCGDPDRHHEFERLAPFGQSSAGSGPRV